MHSIKRGRANLTFDIINYLILGLVGIIVIYPLYFVLIASISEPDAVNNGIVIWRPIGFTLEGYRKLFEDARIWMGYRNTLFYTVCGTVFNVILTLITAYPLSRTDLAGRKGLIGYFLFTMFFSGGLIPTYLLVNRIGLYNSPFVLIVLGGISIFNLIIAKSFFESSIPPDLREAAEIDGCGNFRYFIEIVLPLSKALIGVLVVYYGISHWNQYFDALIYLSKDTLYPLQMVLREILIQNSNVQNFTDESMLQEMLQRERYAGLIKYGVIIVASIPMLTIYPFVQKYFAKGVMLGSVKG